MGEMEKLKAFLETVNYEEKRCGCLEVKDGRYPFVTISREVGAGGNSLAETILNELGQKEGGLYAGWQKFNQELCVKVTDDPKLKASLSSLLSSEYRSYVQDMLEQMVIGSVPQDTAHRKIFELIQSLALYGKVIIVGRGGACLTRSMPLGIHLRLVAPIEMRVRNMARLFKWTHEKAKEYVRDEDKAREKFVKTYFNRDIKDPLLYDVVWNTGAASLDVITKSVIEMIQEKICKCGQERSLRLLNT